jgi:hypothetical protein
MKIRKEVLEVVKELVKINYDCKQASLNTTFDFEEHDRIMEGYTKYLGKLDDMNTDPSESWLAFEFLDNLENERYEEMIGIEII